ncbi:SDR family NAD(P)-dependent oxidoreductase [Nitrospinota bacterium]
MNNKILEGKRAVVTGASTGMGAAIALRYAAAGADIWVVGGSDAEGLKKTIEGCEAHGVKAGGKGYDFSRGAAAGEAVREGAEFLGGLDILMNCASTRNYKLLADLTDDDIDLMFEVNAKSFFAASREAARIMTPQGSGNILMLGSASGERGRAQRSLYCSTKAMVHALTKCLAIELGPLGIRVNCLAPGLVPSGRVKKHLEENPEYAEQRRSKVPLGRLGDPEQMAAAALFIVSPENEFMNGAIVIIDGGSLAG